MPNQFYEQPILNSPYAYPGRHWELDPDGQPTNNITESRRRSSFITPVPKPKKYGRADSKKQVEILFPEPENISTPEQQYDPNTIINEIRGYVDQWRKLPNPDQWQVTPETARLPQHWRQYPFASIRPFFCQIEAIETAIWLTEVAPHQGDRPRQLLAYLKSANEHANPELFRIALKLATGAGKTTVIAMLIAWQIVNAVRRPTSKTFTRGFRICTPGITIRDRLRVVLPSDPDNYHKYRELVPADLLVEVARAKIVITNFHAFKLRERLDVSKVGRSLLKGRGPDLQTTETDGQMLQRVMPDPMGLKSVLVINDEAHHCYRHKATPEGLNGDEDLEGKGDNAPQKRAGIFIGPEFGTVSRPDLVAAAREAADANFDILIACAFNYDAHSAEFEKLGRIPVLKARMNPDLHMADELKNTGAGKLFVVFGEPDIDIEPVGKDQVRVQVKGVDVFKPQTGEVVSAGPEGIACWFIDTDYNEESFFVRHAYFLGQNDPYSALKTTLKAEIDQEAWESLHSAVSRPFPKPASGRIAVKVINHLGDEVMKVFKV